MALSRTNGRFPSILLRFIRMIVIVGCLLLFSWLALAAFAWTMADKMIFPEPMVRNTEVPGVTYVTASDGNRIAVLYLPNEEAQRVILYAGGNAEDLGTSRFLLEDFHAQGFAVLGFDYPGYGMSEGSPREETVFAAAEAAWQFLRNQGHAEEAILLYGFSLGSGSATYLATKHQHVGGLILQSPFLSAFRVVTGVKLLPFDRFDNLSRLPDLFCPLLILHGTADQVIPFTHGQALYEKAQVPTQFLRVEGAGHNNLTGIAGEVYWQTISQFVNSLPEVTPGTNQRSN